MVLILNIVTDIELDPNIGLVQRSQKGDQTAFGQLIKQHQRWLYALAMSHLRVTSDAEDVVQESLIRAWADLSNLRNCQKFRNWLAQIVIRQCANWRRQHKPMVLFSELSEAEQIQTERKLANLLRSTEEDYSHPQRIQILECIHHLPERYRNVLYLRFLGSCSWEEVSRILNISKKTVEVRLYRGKKLLRRKLKYHASNQI